VLGSPTLKVNKLKDVVVGVEKQDEGWRSESSSRTLKSRFESESVSNEGSLQKGDVACYVEATY
jgi:hypothetical protein